MAPTVHYADPDGRGIRDDSNVQEGIIPSPVETGDTQQPESNLSKEIPEQGTASESPAPNDGRRRSSRLRGKVALGNTGPGDGSPPIMKQSSGSGKRGRRKKAPVLESVQSIGDSVEELKNEVIVESLPKELAAKSEELGASPAGDGIQARCGGPTLPNENGEESAAKVVNLEGLDILDDSFCEDGEGTGTARPRVDSICENGEGTGIAPLLVDTICEDGGGTGIAPLLADTICEDGEGTGTARPLVDSICEGGEGSGTARPRVDSICENGEGTGIAPLLVDTICEDGEGTGIARPLVDSICEDREGTGTARPLVDSICENGEGTGIAPLLVDTICEDGEGTGTARPLVDSIYEDGEGSGTARPLVDSICEDGEGSGTARSRVDSRGDFCDSNIFENLQSIVNLHPEENALHNDVPSTCTREPEEKIVTQVEDLPEANLTKEGIRGEGTRLINVNIGGGGPKEFADEEVTTLSIVQASCEITQACKTLTGSEAGPVESDLKEEGDSRGSNSTSKVGEAEPKLNGNDGADGSKLNGNDGEDSSSVTSRDDVAHTTATCEDKDSKVTSGDNAAGGVSKLASEASLNDVHMATNPELLVEESNDVQSRKGIPKEPHEDDDHMGSRSSSEAKFSRVSPSRSRIITLDSQVLVNGNDDQRNVSSIVLEERKTLQTTSEIACPQSGEGEDPLQLDKKSASLKSVNQETGVCNGGVPSAMKVESKAEVTRSLSRHIVGGEDDSSGVTEGDVNTTSEKVDESVGINSKAGWVKCDDCKKWRSIPVALAEKIGETNAYWSCKENPNKQFADCSIPQVKSNEEINRDLGISESSFCDEEDDIDATCDSRPLYNGIQENGQAVWTLIKRNIFKHRSQKHQDADEAMVCQCAPPKSGEVACGEDCLNRILNVECLPQQCPCGLLCTNQQFQKRCYANVELFRCGKKGHGLRALEDIRRGSFIIEYVGEVLDMASFEERQKDYSMNSQKHFYFMTLSANEIIDACSKGNFGRFINHSCEPNCQTEKWMVDGEVCIGLFAIRDLKEGEEITFDYNFVRVGGADAKKCECGANKCRGFIGVDPDTPQNVVDIDSDEGEDPEPIMLHAESDEELDDKTKERTVKKARMIAVSDNRHVKLGGLKRKFYSGAAKDMERPKKKRRVKTAASTKIASQPAPSKLFAGSRFGSRNTYHSDVEEKLGELTNESGGLKQRDAAKQYLKLLVLTAASGGTVNGAAACSARDLSMLLEALLKTQKLYLLKDIMNKNGLQMFHNLLKQFRKSFEKRPILRKLLKVLDHLAKNRVLTVEHIYSPPRSGTECFSDTLFDLSRHDDMEVQKMARDFRKQYVPPRPQYKPVINTERSLVKSPLQQPPVAVSSPSVTESPQVGSTTSNSAEQMPSSQVGAVEEKSANPPTATRRKRPSRWDTVPDTGTAVVATGVPNSAAAAASVRHLPAVSSSQQVSSSVPADPSSRVSITPAPTGVPGRPSGPFPPVQQVERSTSWVQQVVQPQHHQAYPPGHISGGLPGQRQAIPPGLMHLRVPMGNELPPAPQRPYSGPHPAMQGPLQMPPVSAHPLAFSYNRGPSNQAAPSLHAGQWPLMHPMFAGPPFPPPPPPLPPGSVRPGWGHTGPRQPDVRTASVETGQSEAAGEPPVPGMSPASLRVSCTSENITSVVPEGAPAGSARPVLESSGTRSEASAPRTRRDEHGAKTSGHHDSSVVNRARSNVPDSQESTLQAYPHPEGVQGKGQREMSWETPECSSFHHHVSGMIRARVEMKHLVHYKDLEKFCSKLTEVVTRKEIKKYRENKIQGMTKTIFRSKLLEKVDAYVDLQIGLYSKSKSGEGQS